MFESQEAYYTQFIEEKWELLGSGAFGKTVLTQNRNDNDEIFGEEGKTFVAKQITNINEDS